MSEPRPETPPHPRPAGSLPRPFARSPLPAAGRGGRCATRYRRSSSGSRTVADSPIASAPARGGTGARDRGEEVAALRGDERMQFVQDHAPQALRRTGALRDGREAARAAPAWSAGCRAGARSGGRAYRRWCRRCGFRPGSAAPSRGRASPGCARYRRRAPSAARCRGCEAAPPPARRTRAPPDRPGSAGSRRASCRRRSARPAAPSARPAPWPEVRAGAAAAPAAAANQRRKGSGRRPGGGSRDAGMGRRDYAKCLLP